MKNILKIGIAAALSLGLAKIFQWKNSTERMNFALSNPRVFSVDTNGIVLRTEIAVQNPTKERIKVTKPIITLTSNGKFLASSQPQNKEFTFEPLSSSMIDTISIVLPWSALKLYAFNLLLKQKQLKAAIAAKDIQGFTKLIGIPLEMSYELYSAGISIKSNPQKIM